MTYILCPSWTPYWVTPFDVILRSPIIPHNRVPGSVLAIAHGRSMARITAPAVLGEAALLAALSDTPAIRPLTYRRVDDGNARSPRQQISC